MRKILLIIQTILLISGGLFVSTAPVNAADQPAVNEFKLLRDKWANYLIGSGYDLNDPDIAAAIELIDSKVTNSLETGRWDTMEKGSGRTYLWEDLQGSSDAVHAAAAYNRLRDMTIAWATFGSALYQNETLRDDIVGGLDWLYTNRYNETIRMSGNWWEWEIGIPQSLGDMMVLLHNELTPSQIANYAKAINKFNPDPNIRTGTTMIDTGANRLDKVLAVILVGMNTENSGKVQQGRDAIGHVFPYVTKGDGFYEDGSFVFHDNIAYTGSYGGLMISNMARLLVLLEDSPWPITDPNRENMFRWVTDSYEPLIYRGRMMDMVYGRAISRHLEAKQFSLTHVLGLLDFAPPELEARFKSMVKSGIESDPLLQNVYEGRKISDIMLLKALMSDDTIEVRDEPVMHKQFSVMDRIVHYRPGYAFGLSMTSSRIANFETGIGGKENPKGWYTGEGMTYLYNEDMPYLDAFWPTVDSYRLPGTTSDGAPRVALKTSTKDWVGGSSIDSLYGVAGMDLDPDNSTLSGKKSWFMFDDEIVALGAGLASTDNRKVETIVENRMLTSDGDNKLIVNDALKSSELGWSESMNGVQWAHLEGKADTTGIGYYFPRKATVEGLRESRTGTWQDIHPSNPPDPITRNYLSLAINHGTNPVSQSYEYVLLPGKDAAATADYSDEPDILTLSNTADLQAVKEMSLGITAANFWTAGITDLIMARNPASVMVREEGDTLAISVSDPTQKQAKVSIDLAKTAIETLELDASIEVLQMEPTIRLEVDTTGASGKSHQIVFRIDPNASPELPEELPEEELPMEPDAAAYLTIPVEEDAYVEGGSNAGNNYMNVGQGFLNIRNGSDQYNRRVFLKYDLSELEGNVERAALHVYGKTRDNNGNESDVGVFEVADDEWNESTITYANMPPAGERLDLQTVGNPDQWWQFNVTPFVQSKLDDNKWVSLSLQQVGRNLHAEIRSWRNGNGQFKSYLELLLKDTVPPTTTVAVENEQATGVYEHDVNLHFTAVDNRNGWGVYKTEYRINDGEWKTVRNGQLRLYEEGTYTISYRSIDKARNEEEARQLTLTIARPAMEWTGPESLTGGQDLTVSYKLNTRLGDIYVQSVSLAYDADLLTYKEAVSLQEDIEILPVSEEAGELKLVIEGKGQPIAGGEAVISLTFQTSRVMAAVDSKLQAVQSFVEDSKGNELELKPTAHLFTLKPELENPDPEEPGEGNNANNGGTGAIGETSLDDLKRLAQFWRMSSSSSGWEQAKALDVSGDGKIDLIDLAMMARAYKSKDAAADKVKNKDKEQGSELPQLPQGKPSYYLKLDNAPAKVGDQIKVYLHGANIQDLYAYELELGFDPSYLQFVEASASLEGFTLPFVVKDSKLVWTHTKLGQIPGESGDVELGYVIFKVKKEGMSSISWNSMFTVDHQLEADRFTVNEQLAVGEDKEAEEVLLSDIEGHWAANAIVRAVKLGFINGYGDHTFRPEAKVTRAEFVVMLGRALQLERTTGAELQFNDAANIPAWAMNYVAKSVEDGIISGYGDHTFRAENAITRSELTAMIVRALELPLEADNAISFEDADQIADWAKPYVAAAAYAGVIKGKGNNQFAPNESATRAEAVILILALRDFLED